MTEQKIEKLMVERFEEILEGTGIQVIGTLQPTLLEKAEEESSKMGVVVVKVSPREYETPTVPTCRMNCAISVSLRADKDFNGRTYLEVCDTIINELERFQKCLHDVHELYSIPDEFNVTGFLLGQGQTSIDQTNKTWNYIHNYTVYGILDNGTWVQP